MKISLIETKELIERILKDPSLGRVALLKEQRSEAEFYSAVQQFREELRLASEEWFTLLSIFRGRILRQDLKIMAKLSENQRNSLPPETF